jgi:hypothetical protein
MNRIIPIGRSKTKPDHAAQAPYLHTTAEYGMPEIEQVLAVK